MGGLENWSQETALGGTIWRNERRGQAIYWGEAGLEVPGHVSECRVLGEEAESIKGQIFQSTWPCSAALPLVSLDLTPCPPNQRVVA